MHVIIDIVIPADEFLKQYQTASAVVSTRSRDGRTVTFPANILQPFVLHDGIKGSFKITFDNVGKFKSIERLTH
jgi:hypothetical protein